MACAVHAQTNVHHVVMLLQDAGIATWWHADACCFCMFCAMYGMFAGASTFGPQDRGGPQACGEEEGQGVCPVLVYHSVHMGPYCDTVCQRNVSMAARFKCWLLAVVNEVDSVMVRTSGGLFVARPYCSTWHILEN